VTSFRSTNLKSLAATCCALKVGVPGVLPAPSVFAEASSGVGYRPAIGADSRAVMRLLRHNRRGGRDLDCLTGRCAGGVRLLLLPGFAARFAWS
jgi:hypothetical protein